jgi:rubrerythrin
MNAKKKRELLVVGLEGLLHSESKIVQDYRALAEMLDGIPAGLLLDWVVIEEETHHTLLVNILHSLKQTKQTERGSGEDDIEMERETMLCWINRLKMKEQKIVAVCRALRSEAGRETVDVVDAFLDALIMDSEKHQRFLVTIEKAVDDIMMSRPQ